MAQWAEGATVIPFLCPRVFNMEDATLLVSAITIKTGIQGNPYAVFIRISTSWPPSADKCFINKTIFPGKGTFSM